MDNVQTDCSTQDVYTVKIKPCPHCGSSACLTANYSFRSRSYFVFVKCDLCGAQGKIYNSTSDPAEESWNNAACNDAVRAWNLRTKEQGG